MKDIKKILLTTLVLAGIGLAGCVAEVGGGYHHPWYHDDGWAYGGPRVGVGVDVHPPG